MAAAHGQIGRGRGHECRGENSNCLDDHRRSACVSGQNSITRNQIHFLSSVIIAQKFSIAVSLEVSIIRILGLGYLLIPARLEQPANGWSSAGAQLEMANYGVRKEADKLRARPPARPYFGPRSRRGYLANLSLDRRQCRCRLHSCLETISNYCSVGHARPTHFLSRCSAKAGIFARITCIFFDV